MGEPIRRPAVLQRTSRRGWLVGGFTVVAATVMVVQSAGVAVAAPRKPVGPPDAHRTQAVTGVHAVPSRFQKLPNAAAKNFTAQATRLPSATSSTLVLS